MVKDSMRKCSHCGCNGHNSRTCTGNGKGCFKLFGVTIVPPENGSDMDERPIRKSFSMGNLEGSSCENNTGDASGYLSDGPVHSGKRKAAHDRKKGVPWSEEEHLTFLAGLQKLGKGDWRGISKNYVMTRTPTQVASHAQKYFNRLALSDRKKRRSSLFDMPLNDNVLAAKVPPTSNTDKIPEVQPKASTSPIVSRKETMETPEKASIPDEGGKISLSSSCSEASSVHPLAVSSALPNVHGVSFMVGVPVQGQSFPTSKMIPAVPVVPVINFPRKSFVCSAADPRHMHWGQWALSGF